jgi:GTPase SAR1 family protein
MATNQQIVPEFKLVLVGDGGVGMFDRYFFFV